MENEMTGQRGLFAQGGAETNKPKIGGKLELLGDPKIKPEKPHTIIGFPGGDVEIARTSDGDYWVHVAVRDTTASDGHPIGSIVRVRVDAERRYADEANATLNAEIKKGDIRHIAFLVRPAVKP